jgi:hypothetical protein
VATPVTILAECELPGAPGPILGTRNPALRVQVPILSESEETLFYRNRKLFHDLEISFDAVFKKELTTGDS